MRTLRTLRTQRMANTADRPVSMFTQPIAARLPRLRARPNLNIHLPPLPRRGRESLITASAWLLLVIFLIGAILPFYWMIVTSVKPNAELFSRQSQLWVQQPTRQHYIDLLNQTLFGNWFINSVIVSAATTFISLALGSLAAYGVVRGASGFTTNIARIVLLVYLIPRAVLFIPLYEELNSLGMLDTLQGLVVAYLSFTLPFCLWLLIGYFKAIPRELDEAALVDGATPLGAWWRVILPIARPGLVAASIFAFSMSWNEFMYPLIFIQSSAQQPITSGIAALQQGDVFAWGQLMAAGTLAAIPIVIVYSFIQRHIVTGLTMGAVKG